MLVCVSVCRSNPAGDTVTVPLPFGNTRRVAAGRKTTPTVRSDETDRRHWFGTSGWIVHTVEKGVRQASKRWPAVPVAVSVTDVPDGKDWLQACGQLIPGGELVTVPLPAWITTVSLGSALAAAPPGSARPSVSRPPAQAAKTAATTTTRVRLTGTPSVRSAAILPSVAQRLGSRKRTARCRADIWFRRRNAVSYARQLISRRAHMGRKTALIAAGLATAAFAAFAATGPAISGGASPKVSEWQPTAPRGWPGPRRCRLHRTTRSSGPSSRRAAATRIPAR